MSNLFNALDHKLVLSPGEMVPDLEEIVALISEFITADVLTSHKKRAIAALAEAVTQTEIFGREDTQQVVGRAIQVLQDVTALNPDLVISLG